MTFAQLFATPLGVIGESLSQFFAGTMRHVPILLWPIVIVLILFIVIVLILMYSKYEVHLPFMMGSLRPSPHAAVTRTRNVVEQIENSSNQSENRVQELENKVQKLQLELQQKNLPIEHNTTPTTRPNRSSSIERTNQPRERSLSSNRRPNTEAITENELRQRTTSSDIGFRKDFFPE
jgi:multidrug efflux pump subunit AcrB